MLNSLTRKGKEFLWIGPEPFDLIIMLLRQRRNLKLDGCGAGTTGAESRPGQAELLHPEGNLSLTCENQSNTLAAPDAKVNRASSGRLAGENQDVSASSSSNF